ncbi:E3 ubiquitin-protein ligase RAD18 isoform X1 [Mobula birostris]|uniref:E3 ubiquitin-protein ligase RAD18 isoform X1 n=1 Tax=Mobula birostris TaxID=1983395 RepID=UPI003B28503E
MWRPEGRDRLLAPMDEILRCGICFDYFNIAMMIPHCSHNYCSLCVRKFLSYKTQCPICCVTVTEPELLNNRVLDELVKCFRTARNLQSKYDLQSPPVSPRAAQTVNTSKKNQSSGYKVHTKMKKEMKYMDRFLSRSHSSVRQSGIQSTEEQCEEEQNDTCTQSVTENCLAELAPKDNDAEPSTSGPKEIVKVDCPVCAVAIPEKNINRHLDGCLIREDKKESLRSCMNRRKLLPKLVYNLLSDRDLKKKLKEYGLSTQGSKAQLIKRHQEFIQMYNSQCDSLNPKSAKDIAKEIEKNEKTRAQLEAKVVENAMKFTKDQSEEEIDALHKDYHVLGASWLPLHSSRIGIGRRSGGWGPLHHPNLRRLSLTHHHQCALRCLPDSRIKHKGEFQKLITEVKKRWQSKVKKLKSEQDEETEEQCLTVTGEEFPECQTMDCNPEEACQNEPHLPEMTGSLVTNDTLKCQPYSFDVVLPSTLSTSSSDSDICRDPEYSRDPEESTDIQFSNVSTGKRKMRELFGKRSSKDKRARM